MCVALSASQSGQHDIPKLGLDWSERACQVPLGLFDLDGRPFHKAVLYSRFNSASMLQGQYVAVAVAAVLGEGREEY